MQSGTDAHTEVPAVGDRDIWKHSFHCGENMATRLGHREELTLKELLRDWRTPAVGGCPSNPAVKLVWRGKSTTGMAPQLAGGTNTSHVAGQHEFHVALHGLSDTGAGKHEGRFLRGQM